jgi:putative peptidoglycan lipid II flippase
MDGPSHASHGAAASDQRSTDATVTGSLASAVRIVSGLTLLSRFAGLLRDVVMVRVLGDGVLASAFRAAYMLPNVFRRLFGEGALSAAFLPEYAQLRRDEPAVAGELATLTLRLLTLVTGGITLLIEVVLLLLVVFLPEDAEHGWRDVSFKLMMLMLPMMPMVCITAILGGMLQSHGRFGPPAAAPIILNFFQIAASLAFFLGWTSDRLVSAYAVGAAAVAASVVQILWSLHALRGRVAWGRASEAAHRHGRRVLGRFLPAVLGLGTLQLNTMMDAVIAMWPVWVGPTMFGIAVTLDESSNGILGYTQQLYQFPLGVFGLAVATAVFPLLSRASDDAASFASVLRRGLRLSFFIGLPATVGLALVRHDLVYVVFGGPGGFSDQGVARGAAVLLGFAPGVWAYSLNHVLTRAFYARHNTRTPMRVAVSMVALNLTLNLTLIWPLREAGLAWSTAISAVVQTVVLLSLCGTRLGLRPLDRETLGAFARITLAAVLMAAAVTGVMLAWPGDAATWTARAIRLAACVVAGAVGYAVAARALRAPELSWILQRAPRGAGSESVPMSMD